MDSVPREITAEVSLCDRRGHLNPQACGWSRRPLHVCNLRGRFPRKKKWNYWCVTDERFAFSLTIAHVDYLSLGAVYLLEYESRNLSEGAVVRPFSRHAMMPETVAGSVRFDHRALQVSFEETGTGLVMNASSPRIGGKLLSANLEIDRPEGHETLNVVVPWNARTFQFTSKQQCLPARGSVTWGSQAFTFAPGSAFACLDFGRGIWPYRTAWNWAAFSGRSGADVVGINMGARWTDGTGMNENGIVLNGKLHKLFDDILFDYDSSDFMRPWRMTSASSGAVDLTFTPFFDKTASINLLVLRSTVHQMFGHYAGRLAVEGRVIPIDGIPGWAEEHYARW